MIKRTAFAYVVAILLGALVTSVDLFADRGEISPAVVLLLFLFAGGIVGAMHSRFSLALAILTAIILPVTHLTLHLLGHKTTLQPDTVGSILMVGVVSACATSAGVLMGVAARRTFAPGARPDRG